MAFLRPQRQQRYITLRSNGFLPFEALTLSTVRFSEAPYIRRLMRDRLKIAKAFLKEAEFNKWSQKRKDKEYRAVIKNEYLEHKWIKATEVWRIGRTLYKAAPFMMLKEYRQRAIDSGEYFKKPPKRIRRDAEGNIIKIIIYKGDVEAQKRRARARRSISTGTPEYEKYLRQRREQKKRAKDRKWAREQ